MDAGIGNPRAELREGSIIPYQNVTGSNVDLNNSKSLDDMPVGLLILFSCNDKNKNCTASGEYYNDDDSAYNLDVSMNGVHFNSSMDFNATEFTIDFQLLHNASMFTNGTVNKADQLNKIQILNANNSHMFVDKSYSIEVTTHTDQKYDNFDKTKYSSQINCVSTTDQGDSLLQFNQIKTIKFTLTE